MNSTSETARQLPCKLRPIYIPDIIPLTGALQEAPPGDYGARAAASVGGTPSGGGSGIS